MSICDTCTKNSTCPVVSLFGNSCLNYVKEQNKYISHVTSTLSMNINNDMENFIVNVVKSYVPLDEQITVNAKKIYEAIQKQTPKKPNGTNRAYIMRCPNCSAVVMRNLSTEQTDYCIRCGQAIDWTEGNE